MNDQPPDESELPRADRLPIDLADGHSFDPDSYGTMPLAPKTPTLDYQPKPDSSDDLDQVNWFAYIAVAVVLVSLAVALIGMGVILSMVIRYFQGIMG